MRIALFVQDSWVESTHLVKHYNMKKKRLSMSPNRPLLAYSDRVLALEEGKLCGEKAGDLLSDERQFKNS